MPRPVVVLIVLFLSASACTSERSAQARTMITAFDEPGSHERGLAILKRTNRLEVVMDEVLEAVDRETFLETRNEFTAALDEALALIEEAAADHERFIAGTHRFGIKECYAQR